MTYFRSCASYTPSTDCILGSGLNSSHRIVPLCPGVGNTFSTSSSANIADNCAAHSSVHVYAGHVNEKYSITSTVYSNSFGNFILSGSEDGKVRIV